MATGKNMGQAMKDVMADPEMRKAGKEVSKYVGKVISDRLLPSGVDEKAVLDEAQDFIGKEVGMHIVLNPAEDPENKRRFAIPGRPALLIK
jgi:leucyl-tRNA synthetase